MHDSIMGRGATEWFDDYENNVTHVLWRVAVTRSPHLLRELNALKLEKKKKQVKKTYLPLRQHICCIYIKGKKHCKQINIGTVRQ